METKHLKKYAPEARRDFIDAVANKAAVYGLLPKEILPMKEEGDVVIIGDRPFPRSVAKQRKELEARIRKEGFQQFIEAVAYTWFNRFVAIRYMELHGYLDHGYRVLSHPEGQSAPELLENAERVELPGLNRDEVVDLKLDGGKDEQLYQMLLLAQCNALHKAMPFLFETIKGGTELLLPDNLLHTDSLVRTLVNDIPDEQWENVEVIGWLYQFYISEKKDEVIGKVVKSEDIPAATQLFTPNWIVRYLLHNTLGRKWLATYPDSPLKQQMEFYIEPANQTAEVQQQLDQITPNSLNPEELTLLDPACGSGHILVEAYDLFKAIYEERGYRARDIPNLILTNNLFGLEIDDRAAQLATLALILKARADDPGLLKRELQPNVRSLQESHGLDAIEISETLNHCPDKRRPLGDDVLSYVTTLVEAFKHAKTYGSLIPLSADLTEMLLALLQQSQNVIEHSGMLDQAVARQLIPLIKQSLMLTRQYDAVVANPPFLNRKGMNPAFRAFAKTHYPLTKTDTFAMFMQRIVDWTVHHSHLGLVTPYVWMYLTSHESLRDLLLDTSTISSLIQLEYNAFEPACVPVCTFTAVTSPNSTYQGTFIQLASFKGHENQAPRTIEAIRNPQCGWSYSATNADFKRIPGKPIAFWLHEKLRDTFSSGHRISDLGDAASGMFTCDNEKFLRHWYEVSVADIALPDNEKGEIEKRYFPYNKGGGFRKWAGNYLHIVDFYDGGNPIREFRESVGQSYALPGQGRFFCEGVTWNDVTSGMFSARLMPEGFIYDKCAPTAFFGNHEQALFSLGIMNSVVTEKLSKVLNPTLHFTLGDFGNLPLPQNIQQESIARLVTAAIRLSEDDWDSLEISWGFQKCPLIQCRGKTVKMRDAWKLLHERRQSLRGELRSIEESINSEVVDAFGLNGVLDTNVKDENISAQVSNIANAISGHISYAIGCMMGRYSLDEPGLVYAYSANTQFDPSRYDTFPADEDGIIPITEQQWFPDDAAARFEEFATLAWSEGNLEENLTFVAECLGSKKGESSRDCIRRYMASNFIKHHLTVYRKRPIYWLFCSGKQRAFQCLVYMHRYHSGTLARIRTEYVVPLHGKMNARMEQLDDEIVAISSTSQRKKAEKERDKLLKQREELQNYDEKLRHLADQQISLDLNEGVKVNYGKLGDVLAELKTVTGGKTK